MEKVKKRDIIIFLTEVIELLDNQSILTHEEERILSEAIKLKNNI